MSHTTIVTLFWVSLVIGFILGITLFIWWVKRIWKKVNNSVKKAAIYSFPGLLLLIICFIPSIYLNGLLKREKYCIDVIQFNKGIEKNDDMIKERCSCLDVDELFLKAKEN